MPFVCILADNINYHLYQNHLIIYAQYGFVKGRSTELQLLNCSSLCVKAVDFKKFDDTVYIDFSKTVDTVLHNNLISYYTNYPTMEFAVTLYKGSQVSQATANKELK